MVWDDETILHLRELWAQGLSTAEIGRRLNVSKNAIVGKAHRLDLDARPSPIRREGAKPAPDDAPAYPRMLGPTLPPLASAAPPPTLAPPSNVQALRVPPAVVPRPAVVVVPRQAPRPPAAPTESAPAPAPSRRAAPSCCWPIGEPGTKTFRFCDEISEKGKPYCEEHARVAYVRIRDRKEDAA